MRERCSSVHRGATRHCPSRIFCAVKKCHCTNEGNLLSFCGILVKTMAKTPLHWSQPSMCHPNNPGAWPTNVQLWGSPTWKMQFQFGSNWDLVRDSIDRMIDCMMSQQASYVSYRCPASTASLRDTTRSIPPPEPKEYVTRSLTSALQRFRSST